MEYEAKIPPDAAKNFGRFRGGVFLFISVEKSFLKTVDVRNKKSYNTK